MKNILYALVFVIAIVSKAESVNPLVEEYNAVTDRMRLLAPLIEAEANAKLKEAETEYKRVQSADLKKNINFFNMLIAELREDMKFLVELQNYINRANKNLLEDINTLRRIKGDGKIYPLSETRFPALQRLMAISLDGELIDLQLQQALIALKKISDLNLIISETGLIV